jgi:hypothetical protein
MPLEKIEVEQRLNKGWLRVVYDFLQKSLQKASLASCDLNIRKLYKMLVKENVDLAIKFITNRLIDIAHTCKNHLIHINGSPVNLDEVSPEILGQYIDSNRDYNSKEISDLIDEIDANHKKLGITKNGSSYIKYLTYIDYGSYTKASNIQYNSYSSIAQLLVYLNVLAKRCEWSCPNDGKLYEWNYKSIITNPTYNNLSENMQTKTKLCCRRDFYGQICIIRNGEHFDKAGIYDVIDDKIYWFPFNSPLYIKIQKQFEKQICEQKNKIKAEKLAEAQKDAPKAKKAYKEKNIEYLRIFIQTHIKNKYELKNTATRTLCSNIILKELDIIIK